MTGKKSDRFIEHPNLPENDCSVMIAGGLRPEATDALYKRGIKIIQPVRSSILPEPTSSHADMLMTYFGDGEIALSPEEASLKNELKQYGCVYFGNEETQTGPELSPEYPGDAIYNVCIIGNRIITGKHRQTTNNYLKKQDPERQIITVNQGYTKCSICVVNMNTIITEDRGVAKVLKSNGIEVLLIDPGHVSLPGYDRGFFGGCCGLISKNVMAFNGDLDLHPQAKIIRDFLLKHNIETLSLSSGQLTDIGSFIQLREYV